MNRRRFLQLTGAALAGSAAGCTAAGSYAHRVEPEQLVVERRVFRSPRLRTALDGFRVVFMSDHHLYPFTPRELIVRAIEQSNALRPDLVLLGGDYVYTRPGAIHELAAMFVRLNAKFGVYAVLGNHDFRAGAGLIRSVLAGQSIEVLTNRGVHLGPNGGRLYLAGLNSVVAGAADGRRAFAGCRASDFAVALVHEPDYFPTLVRSTPVELQLSGHSHGGQVRIPGLGPVALPRWGRVYHTGFYELNGRTVYVGRGLGMVGLPLRFDCPPELTEITFEATGPWSPERGAGDTPAA